MIVLDTHAWLWWVASPEKLSPGAADAIEQADAIGVSEISLWEVAMLAGRGRIDLDRDTRSWLSHALALERAQALPITPDVAATAASLAAKREFPGDPADGIIYATARASDCLLVTRDTKLREYGPEHTLW